MNFSIMSDHLRRQLSNVTTHATNFEKRRCLTLDATIFKENKFLFDADDVRRAQTNLRARVECN